MLSDERVFQLKLSQGEIPSAIRGKWNTTIIVDRGTPKDENFRSVAVRLVGVRSVEHLNILTERVVEDVRTLLRVSEASELHQGRKKYPPLTIETLKEMMRVELNHLPVLVTLRSK